MDKDRVLESVRAGMEEGIITIAGNECRSIILFWGAKTIYIVQETWYDIV